MTSAPTAGGSDPFADPGFGANGHAGPGGGASGYQSGYTSSPYGSYGRYAAPYSGISGGYGSGVYGSGSGMYSHYGTAYGTGIGRSGPLYGGAQQAQAGGAAVLSGMQEAMQRFARVSGLMEEVLRNLHLLFDGVFGLGYSIGAFHDEAKMWLSVKTGPVAFIRRVCAKLARLWRLITLFLCSPFAGEFSPISLVLQLLGFAPTEQALMNDASEEVFSNVPLSSEAASPSGRYSSDNASRESFQRRWPLFRSDSNL